MYFIIFRFKTFGAPDPHRPAEDVAFSVARFFQKGGSVHNYYMVFSLISLAHLWQFCILLFLLIFYSILINFCLKYSTFCIVAAAAAVILHPYFHHHQHNWWLFLLPCGFSITVEQILVARLVDHSLLQVTTTKHQLMNMVSNLCFSYHYVEVCKMKFNCHVIH